MENNRVLHEPPMVPFHRSSYLSQVRRLRALGKVALLQYPVKVAVMSFINHGENTTFCIRSKSGKKFLLRIHRRDYHTQDAIEEELSFLSLLSKKSRLLVPTPVRSKNGRLIEEVSAPGVPESRFCCLFEWIEGQFIQKSLNPNHMHELGKLIGQLQLKAPKSVRHRRYWRSEGLVGSTPKFGSIDKLAGVRPQTQKIITQARKRTLAKLQSFERQFPERQGLIHADLHFGNILASTRGIAAIDFDDCGFGFHAYDIAIPLISAGMIIDPKNKSSRLLELKEALIEGYSTYKKWDRHDAEILPHLITARKLLMLGWLNSRSDNPRLKKYLRRAVKDTIKHINVMGLVG